VRARGTKSKNRLANYYDVAGLEAPPEEREMDLLLPPPPKMGNTGVELKNVAAKVGTGDETRWLFRNLNLSLKPGECTGVVGRNGVRKSTLLRLCLGELVPDEGEVTKGHRVIINSIDQGRVNLDDSKSVMSEVADIGGETVTFGEQKIS